MRGKPSWRPTEKVALALLSNAGVERNVSAKVL